jgi:hypothetical protein
MEAQTAGLVAAAATFGSVWFGHVAVRAIEFRATRLWMPSLGFAAAGLACLWLSLRSAGPGASIGLGIIGLVLLYDILELRRQAARVRRGRAVANPANPRHRAAFEAGTALLEDLFLVDPPPPGGTEGRP